MQTADAFIDLELLDSSNELQTVVFKAIVD